MDSLVISEAFIFDENTLHSALAHENEKPYENLYNLATTYGSLNRTSLNDFYINTVKKASLETYPRLW